MPNGITSTFDYDGMSRLTRLKHQSASATLFDNQYSYNSANQILQITDLTQTKIFGYDNNDRLTSMTNGSANENYVFDGVGNRTSSHRSSSYTYQPFNKIASTQIATYGSDVNGNMSSKTDGTNVWQYAWDYENRMVSTSLNLSPMGFDYSRADQYDALGRRVKSTFPSMVYGGEYSLTYSYDGLDVLADGFIQPFGGEEGGEPGGSLTKYQNAPGIDNKLKLTNGGASKYFLQDHLGSTVALANSAGTLTEQNSYDSFGNPTNATFSSRYQYTGREFDSSTGLQFSRARFYDPNLGRFVSEDPIGFGGGDVNLYGYVWNNPVKFVDSGGTDGSAAAALGNGAAIGGGLASLWPAIAAGGPPAAVAAVGAAAIYGASLVGDYTANHPSNPFVKGPWNPFGNPFPISPPIPVTPSGPACQPMPRAIPWTRSPSIPWPTTPPDGGGGDTCSRLLTLCLNNPWQPNPNSPFGPRKDCGACYRECKANGGAWPFYKCPIS